MTNDELLILAKKSGFAIPDQPEDWLPAFPGQEFNTPTLVILKSFQLEIENLFMRGLADAIEANWMQDVSGLSKKSLIRRDNEAFGLVVANLRANSCR